ncbi:hypothetical protein EV426DRAFT_576125 [Tirmania nivea]|nr:hypothetical protein EV426DRAFT_576125 [Tirmania nivea]
MLDSPDSNAHSLTLNNSTPGQREPVTEMFDNEGELGILQGFLYDYGRAFYQTKERGLEKESGEKIMLRRGCAKVQKEIVNGDVVVVPFRAGEETWGLEWVKA